MNKKHSMAIFLGLGITMSLFGMEEPATKKQISEAEQKELNEQLWRAAENRDSNAAKAQIKELIDNGADINAFCGLIGNGADINVFGDNGSTPLYNALESGNTNIVLFLLEQGADVNKGRTGGYTPLHYLIQELAPDEDLEVLVRYGANVNAADDEGLTLLHQAAGHGTVDAVKLLIEHGAHVNATKNDGVSVLKYAVQNSNPITDNEREIIKALLIAGAQFNRSEDEGSEEVKKGINALFEGDYLIPAVLYNYSEFLSMKLALENKNTKIEDTKIEEVLAYARGQGNLNATFILLNYISPERVPLILKESLQAVREILEKQQFTPEIKAKYEALETQLSHRLSLKDQVIEKLKVWVKEGFIQSTLLPFELQIPVNHTQVLVNAVASDNVDNASSALEHGADPRAIDKEGKSLFAIAVAKKAEKIVDLFLKYSINSPELSQILSLFNKEDREYIGSRLKLFVQERIRILQVIRMEESTSEEDLSSEEPSNDEELGSEE